MNKSTWLNSKDSFHSLKTCCSSRALAFLIPWWWCKIEKNTVFFSLNKPRVVDWKPHIEFQTVIRELRSNWSALMMLILVAKQRNWIFLLPGLATNAMTSLVLFFLCFSQLSSLARVWIVLGTASIKVRAYSPVIISMNSSKSTVPEPSASISLIIPSKSSFVSLSSKAPRISFSVLVVM